jgi:hypothetical protein
VERAGVVFVCWGVEDERGEGNEEGLRGEGAQGALLGAGGRGCGGLGVRGSGEGRAGWRSYGVVETDTFLRTRVWVGVAVHRLSWSGVKRESHASASRNVCDYDVTSRVLG